MGGTNRSCDEIRSATKVGQEILNGDIGINERNYWN